MPLLKPLQSKVFILTGGPGTGKTTVINGIIKTYADLHGLDLKKSDLPIILAAPTGRAARRMNELTKLPSALSIDIWGLMARTISRP
mgnify:CR=1 FL=1